MSTSGSQAGRSALAHLAAAVRPVGVLAVAAGIVAALVFGARGHWFSPIDDERVVDPPASYSELEKKIARAHAGDLIDIPAGTFAIGHAVHVRARGVTLKGAGIGKTVLDFRRQREGLQGLEVTAPGALIADLTLRNAQGDGIVVKTGREISLRRVRVDWTGARPPDAGSVGIRVAQLQDMLIDRVEVYGARDAGLFITQARQVIVQVTSGAAATVGMVVSNCEFVDVTRSLFTHNSIGVLVLNAPNLAPAISNSVRVFKNRIVDNTLTNVTASPGVLSSLPAGVGVAVVAHDRVAIFDNDISGNGSTGVLVASYLLTNLPYQDPAFDAFAESVHIHDNRFARNGFAPGSEALKLANSFLPPGYLGDIMRDGFSDSFKLVNGRLPDALRLCLHDNGAARFVDLDATEDFSRPTIDARGYDCKLPPLREVLITPR